MPRSRSWSLESMTRSTRAWWAREHAGGAQERVDQRGLAMVDVRDQGDVAEAGDVFTGASDVGAARGDRPGPVTSVVVVLVVVVEGDAVLLRQGGVLVVVVRVRVWPSDSSGVSQPPNAAGPDCFSLRASSKRR